EFDAGALSLPAPAFMARAAGTITVPLGDRFGLQADLTAASAPGFTTSAALHVFTRDTASYLIGGTLGLVLSPGSIVVAAGPEAELYLDRWTLEAWAGLAVVHPKAPAPTRIGPFVMADVGYYATDNWRLSLGVSSLDGYNSVQFGTEYLFDNFDLPVAATTEVRIGQDGAVLATLGLRAYLGAPSKSLLRRHREDDPSDRSTALYAAAGGTTLNTPHSAPPASPSASAGGSEGVGDTEEPEEAGGTGNEGGGDAQDPEEPSNGCPPPKTILECLFL
ncbi:MAG: hypothetical protein ABI398_12220, partial [Devosia sp.]